MKQKEVLTDKNATRKPSHHKAPRVQPKTGRIVWAVDPTQNPADARNVVKELRSWARQLNCEVQPVSVFSRSTFNLPSDLTYPWRRTLAETARQTVRHYLHAAGADGFLPPELIFVPWISTRKIAATLARYAETHRAPVVFVNTRAKRAWLPVRLGSFAECLTASSRVPVLLLNPAARSTRKVSTILMPTNFEEASRRAFMTILPWARSFKAEVRIFNQIETPRVYADGLEELSLPLELGPIAESVEAERTKKARRWTDLARAAGVKSVSTLKRQSRHLCTEILQAADDNKVDLIVLASNGGQLEQMLLGGVVRDVALKARVPVLIFHQPKSVRRPKFDGHTRMRPKSSLSRTH